MPGLPPDVSKAVQDAALAIADLCHRTGATQLEVGYLHDDVPNSKAGWYAHAQFRGVRVIYESSVGPIDACDGLARHLLEGGGCTHCDRRITLLSSGRSRRCRYRRIGSRWERSCD